MNRKSWIVGKHAIRPAGKPDECFYCHSKLGDEHKHNCVIRKKTVVVKLEIELVRTVPEDWDKQFIEFYLNDSSSCQSNLLGELKELSERLPNECVCGKIKGSFVREATAMDEKDQQLFIDMEES